MPSIVRGVLARPSTLLQPAEPLLRVDGEDFGLHVGVHVAAQVEVFEGGDLVADAAGLLEVERLAGREHLALHPPDQPVLLPFQHEDQLLDLPAVVLAADAEVARGGAAADAVQQARPEPPPLLLVDLMSSVQVRNWRSC